MTAMLYDSIVAILLGGMAVISGTISQYAESPTIGTLEYRQEVGQVPYELPDDIVLLATADCGRIGHEGLLSIEEGDWEPMIVFDCSGHAHTTQWMNENNIIGEVDYYTAVRHNIIGDSAFADLIWFDELQE